jgi:predicted ATPase
MLGTDPGLAPLNRLLAERTQGNPFFLEESVRSLMETRVLVNEGGRLRLDKPIKDIEIAPSVQAVLAARIDRLQPRDKELLQAASAIGKDVAWAVLRDVVAVDQHELEGILKRLQDAEFLYETAISPLAHTFKHVLTYEVAYASLLKEQRKLLHTRALQAIERLYPGRLAEHVETLARHAVQGENWEKAVTYQRQAGIAAAMRSSFLEADSWQRAALSALDNVAESREKSELGIDLRFDLWTAIVTRGDHALIFPVLEEAERLAIAIGDEKRLARIHGYLSMACWWVADYRRALDFGQRALAAARGFGPQGLFEQSLALVALAWTQAALGEYQEAKKGLEEVHAVAKITPSRRRVNNGLPPTTVMALCWLTSAHAELGDFEQGLECARAAVHMAEDLDHPWSRVAAYHALGSLMTKRLQIKEAISILERGRRLCENHVIPGWDIPLASALGSAYVLNGEPAQAIPLLEQSIRQAEANRSLTRQAMRIASLAEAELLNGRPARAAELGREALELARFHGERPTEGHVLRVLGDIAFDNDADDPSLPNLYEQALAISEEFSMRPLQAQCYARISRVLTKRKETARAAAAIDAATQMLAAMKMPSSLG